MSALHLAARNNDVAKVKQLLEKINPNCVDNRDWTCLHEAAYSDSYECLLLILKSSRCNPLAESDDGHTALYLACKNKCSLRTVTALLNSADDIANYGSTEDVTPLHIASSQGNVQLIELLLNYGAIIDVQDFDGNTPLHHAVLVTHNEALITLLYAGADTEIKNKRDGFTPFHLACSIGNYSNIETLFPFISDINHVTTTGDTPLTCVLQGLNDNMIYFLLENGADPNIKNDYGEMAIDIALTLGHTSPVFRTLLSVTDQAQLNRDIILNACKPRYIEILEILLTSDLGPEFFCSNEPFNKELNNYDDQKPIYHLNAPLNSYLNICGYIYEKSPEKFREFFYLFLMRGVEVNPLDYNVCPPLVYAHCVNTSCFNEVFKILIEHGCNVDYCSKISFKRDIIVPDVFYASLNLYPLSMPIMVPYSLHCEPGNFLEYGLESSQLNIIPPQVQQDLLIMIDKNFKNINAEDLPFYVSSLKHLCRYRIRHLIKKGGVKTTQEFLSTLDSLPLPSKMKEYLRYIGH